MPFTIKYRPQTFSDTVGQEHIKTILQQQIKTDGAKANYLFFGPRGTGKTTSARIMAKALNCLNLNDGNPCNNCEKCSLIDEAKTLDFVEIDAASHTGVDNIREEIIDKARYHPTTLKKKVYIIDEVHMLSKGAFNALLKIMEEPPAFMTFILATTEIHKIPDTIISRCQVFQFKKHSEVNITERLRYISEKESITHEPEALALIAKLADGIMRDANKYLEQVSVLGDVTKENISQYLGIVGDERIVQLFDAIKQKNFDTVNTLLDDLQLSGIDLHQFAKQALSYIDSHFLEDPSFFSGLTELLTQIIATIKYFPHPLLSYKTKIYQYLHAPETPTTRSVAAHSIKKSAAPSLEKKKDLTATPPPVVPPKASQKSTPVASTPSPKQESAPVKKKVRPSGDHDYDAIKEQLVGRMDKLTVKSLISKSAIISSIDGENVSMILISKMAELTLKKEDIKNNLEQQLSDIIGTGVRIEFTYMKKEEYFASLL